MRDVVARRFHGVNPFGKKSGGISADSGVEDGPFAVVKPGADVYKPFGSEKMHMTQLGNESNRDAACLQWMRGVGILLVVAGHFESLVFTADWIEALRRWVYLFHMPLFMAISGVLYARSRPLSFGALARKKAIRLLVPYVSISGLILLAKSYAGMIHFPLLYPINLGDLEAFLFYPQRGFAVFLWFLYTLFIIFCLVRALEAVKTPVWGLFLLALGLLVVPLPKWFCLNLVGANLIYFVFGMGMKEVWRTGTSYGRWHHAGLAGASLLVFAALAGLVFARGGGGGWLSVPAALAGIWACWSLALWLGGRQKSFLCWIGDASSSIYLLHTFCMGGVRYLWEQGLGVETVGEQTLFFASSVAVASLLPALLQQHVLERVPGVSLVLLGAVSHRSRA